MNTDDNGPQDQDENDEDETDQEEETFQSFFSEFSKQWLNIQLTHHVSLAASNAFWKMSFEHIFQIYQLKAAQNVTKKIPQFLQARKNLYKEYCPEIKMNFAFKNKNDGSIFYIDADHTPLLQYERDPNYQKLFEEAHIEVIDHKPAAILNVI